MASAAEQMAANLSWGTFAKATELRQRIWFTIGLLCIYRLGTYIPVPGIDGAALRSFMADAQGGLGGMLTMFTGGALARMGVLALGIMPYISASIIVQLLTAMVPSLEALKKQGEAGRKKINQYTRYGTVVLALVQAYGLARGIEASDMAHNPGLFFQASVVITLVGGTMFLMWLGEQITERGIGNGISLIIFVGIIAELPQQLVAFLSQGRVSDVSPMVYVAALAMVVAVLVFVVFMERSLRKIRIQYPRRQVGMKIYDGQSSHLPMKVNPAGVIPPIFASSLLLMPATVSTFRGSNGGDVSPIMATVMAYLGPGQPLYLALMAVMLVFFTYFYTENVAFKVDEVAENLKNQGGFVPGIRPGKKTEDYLFYVLRRVLVLGSAYLTFIVLLPEFIRGRMSIPVALGGTSLLIVVSVTMDTINQIQSHLLAHQYEDLIENSQLRGRRKPGKSKATTRRGPARR